jgi:hypothetical protein
MKFLTITIFLFQATIFPTGSVVGQSLFNQLLTAILNQLLGPVTQTACDTTQESLGIDDTIDCTCDVSLRGIFQGFDGSMTCTLAEERCLIPPSLYCATGELGIDIGGGLFSNTDIESNIDACFQVDSGLPGGLLSIEDICFSFVPDGLSLESCTASIGSTQCTNCTICESGVDFKFDCTNVVLIPGILGSPPLLRAPKIDTCLGLSLIPTNTTL